MLLEHLSQNGCCPGPWRFGIQAPGLSVAELQEWPATAVWVGQGSVGGSTGGWSQCSRDTAGVERLETGRATHGKHCLNRDLIEQ